ncbi:MAG: phosphatase PAP2 family protein [Deltaproteobacteria bacterium]|nr:phosphatase PAP2 family protein [Deltaproteobacteria bacterium]
MIACPARADEPDPADPPAPAASVAQVAPPPPEEPITKPVALRYNTWIDGGVVLGLGASLFVWSLAKANFPNRTCTICDGPGTEVNGFDGAFRDAFVRQDIGPSATISHVLSYGLSPALGAGLAVAVAAADRRIGEAPSNIVMIVESALVAVVLKEALTFSIRRERPQVHALEGDAKAAEIEKQSDPLESFPSGHVLSIMAITSSSATIATMRGYRLAPLIWVAGSTLAATVTYLRIAADQHYMSDNLIGAGLGIGVGVLVPLLFHPPVKPGDQGGLLRGAMLGTTEVNGGRVVNVGWAW